MSTKKTYFIFGIIALFLVIIFLAWYFISWDRNTETISTGELNTPSSETAPSEKEEFNTPPITDSSKNTSTSNPQNPPVATLFSETFSEQKSHKEPISWSTPELKQTDSLDQFIQKTGIFINPKLHPMLTQHDYNIFRCNKNGNPTYGIYFSIAGSLDYPGNIYLDTKRYLAEWSPWITQDLWPILFPDISIDSLDKTIHQNKNYTYLSTHDIEYNSITVIFLNNSKETVYYGILPEFILVTRDMDCLKDASRGLHTSD